MQALLLLINIVVLIVFSVFNNSITDDFKIAFYLILYFSSLLTLFIKKKKFNPITPSFFFILGFIIVFFQVPIEYLFNKDFIVKNFSSYIFNKEVFPLAVGYASLCGICFNIGFSFNKKESKKSPRDINKKSIYDNISIKPFVFLSLIFFIVYIYVTPVNYFLGGYSYYQLEAENEILLSNRIQGYFFKMILISNALILWQTKRNKQSINSIRDFIKLYPKILIIIQVLYIILILMIGDRGPLFTIGLPIILMYFSLREKRLKIIPFLGLVFIAGFFLSIIKITHFDFTEGNFFNAFLEAKEKFTVSEKSESLFPYTVELAGSFFAYTVAWSAWLSGKATYGLSLFMNILMTIPYGVSFTQNLFDIRPEYFNPALLVTQHSGIIGYGIGSDCIGSLILDLSPIITPLVFILFGSFVNSLDKIIYEKRPHNLFLMLTGIIFSSMAFVMGRASIYTFIGSSIFCIIFIKLISLFPIFQKR